MSAATGKEIAKHRSQLDPIFTAIMREHSARCAAEGDPCEWQPMALARIYCDLEEVMERYHVRRKEAA